MSHPWRIVKRAGLAFYDDQGTHHAAALTYYGLMSLFPAALLALSLLGLLGQYPRTYLAIVHYLRDVVPAATLNAVDSSLRSALQSKGTAAGTLAVSAVLALYGMTGVLEAARRALNVVFEVECGRPFLHRKLVDVASTFVLMGLVVMTLVLMFVGGSFARELFGLVGLGESAAEVWGLLRWPAAVVVAVLLFSWLYFITPDVKHRGVHWVTPGAIVGVALWIAVSTGFSFYLSRFADVGAVYGTFAGAIVLIGWLWLTNVALLFGAELDAELERAKEISEGVPPAETLERPSRAGII
jgi:membrane protein